MPNITIKEKNEILRVLPSWSMYNAFRNYLINGTTNDIQDLSPEILAILFMDKGSLESRGHALVFCSEKWNVKSLEDFKTILFNKYKIISTYNKRNVKDIFIGNRLSIKGASLEIFVNLIKGLIHKNFAYKLKLYEPETKRVIALGEDITFTQEQKDLIVALILARGNALLPLEFKGYNWRLHYSNSNFYTKELSTIFFRIFQNLCDYSAAPGDYDDYRTGFATKVHKNYNFYVELFYKTPDFSIKQIPQNILGFLNPTVIFFILLENQINIFDSKAITLKLNITKFDAESRERLKLAFCTKYFIKVNVEYKNNGSYFLSFSEKDLKKLLLACEPILYKYSYIRKILNSVAFK